MAKFITIGETEDVYVTRGTLRTKVDVFPARIGIRKFHGCVEWGAAWNSGMSTYKISRKSQTEVPEMSPYECRIRFGFYPRKGTAWLIEYNARGKMKKKLEKLLS